MTKRKTTRLDMHVHTQGSDGHGSPDDFVKYTMERNLDGIVITDHHLTYTTEGLEVVHAMHEAGLLCFLGCEYSTAEGHVLIYGVAVEDLKLDFYEDIQKVINKVLAAGGVCVPAHPFHGFKRRLGSGLFKLTGIKAVEGRNGQREVWTPSQNRKAMEAAKTMRKKTIGGSDAHSVSYVGCCYTEFKEIIRTESQLIRALKRGKYCARRNKKALESLEWQRSKYTSNYYTNWDLPLDRTPEIGHVRNDGHNLKKPRKAWKESERRKGYRRSFDEWKRDFYGKSWDDPFFYSDGTYSDPSTEDDWLEESYDDDSETDPGSTFH